MADRLEHPDEERAIDRFVRETLAGASGRTVTEHVLVHEIRTLRQQLTEAQADRDSLFRFAGRALRSARVENIGDWDGGDLQEAMLDCGLLEPRVTVVPCGENCVCADAGECGEPECYFVSAFGQRTIDAARLASSSESGTPQPNSEEAVNGMR